MRKSTILLVVALAIAFTGFALVAFGLPKTQPVTTSGGVQQPAAPKVSPTPDHPVDYTADQEMEQRNAVPQYRYRGGASRVISAGVPFVDVKVGIPETPGGNNHMRDQVVVSNAGVAHMVYGVYDGTYPTNNESSADSAVAFLYFYNAYDCSGSNALRNGPEDVQMTAPGPITDPRPRVMNQGGVMIPNFATGVPVAYGVRYILRTETPRADDVSRRGGATMKDGSECLGLFSMDTTLVPANSPPVAVHWQGFALNESTWVATCRPSSNPSDIGWSYTTDRGASWTAVAILPTFSPWFNSVDITGAGNTVYVVSHADPSDPNAFGTTERPCYLKGTYVPGTGSLTWGTITDITGNFELPGFLANMLDIDGIMVGDTLHVIWTDWNNYIGNGFPGPGGHVHHAAVLPDGTVQGPHKITNINIDGRLPDRSYSLFGFAIDVWPMVELSYNSSTKNMYAFWSAPPDDGSYGWGDYEQYGALAVYDIFCSVSPNNGRAWDNPQNVTQTNNPGCDGTPGNPCAHEDQFSVNDRIVNDTAWIVAMVQNYPGWQESCIRSGISPDPGPLTETFDIFRLYKMPARTPVAAPRGDLDKPPVDTTKFFQISVRPRGGVFAPNVQLSNIGLVGFFLDSVTLGAGLNDGFLVTTQNAVANTFVAVGGNYVFQLSINSNGVGPANIGARSGLLNAYCHSVSPAASFSLPLNVTVYVVGNLCFNRKSQIHSGSNYTDIGSQGSIKDAGGLGMYNPLEDMDAFYDGGAQFAWDKGGDNRPACASGPRLGTRQLFNDKFLRCLNEGRLDSVPGTGAYYNLALTSYATDVNDSSIIWENIWEQSTHADSSEFLLQSVKVINVGSTPIDSITMGVLYDVDVQVGGVVAASENVTGDTVVSTLGRTWWLGWIGGNDVAVDSCALGNYVYGAVIIPGSIGNPGDFIRPRGAAMYEQAGFSYNLDCGNPTGGDSLFQRYAWNLDALASEHHRNLDSLTGVWQDTSGATPGFFTICGGPGAGATGLPYRNDCGYMAVAKKVHNMPVNPAGNDLVASYGLEGLAANLDASVDTVFSGPGESYTVIHVVSAGGGLSDLMANAIKGINFYVNHANSQVPNPALGQLRGDLDRNKAASAADVVNLLNYVFAGQDGGNPICVADIDVNGGLSASDVVLELGGVFAGNGGPNFFKP